MRNQINSIHLTLFSIFVVMGSMGSLARADVLKPSKTVDSDFCRVGLGVSRNGRLSQNHTFSFYMAGAGQTDVQLDDGAYRDLFLNPEPHVSRWKPASAKIHDVKVEPNAVGGKLSGSSRTLMLVRDGIGTAVGDSNPATIHRFVIVNNQIKSYRVTKMVIHSGSMSAATEQPLGQCQFNPAIQIPGLPIVRAEAGSTRPAPHPLPKPIKVPVLGPVMTAERPVDLSLESGDDTAA